MTNINFCTPVSFGYQAETLSQSFLEFADDYFFFGGDKAVVQFGYVEGESLGVELVHADASWVSTALKVISYFTIILPTVLLIAKCILRSIHQFHLLPPLRNSLVLKRHEHLVTAQILGTGHFPRVLAELIASYVTSNVDCFGAQEWQRYFGTNIVEPEPELNPDEFYNFWHGPDPIDPTKQVCETHLPPVLRPRLVTDNDTAYQYSLYALSELIEKPQEGHPSSYDFDTRVFSQNGRTHAGPSCWVVMRKDVLSRNQPYPQQIEIIRNLNIRTGAGYEEESSAIDLATVVSAHHVMTGERYLGDDTGMENRWTYARGKETITVNEDVHQIQVGGFSSRNGCICESFLKPSDMVGVVLLRKFN